MSNTISQRAFAPDTYSGVFPVRPQRIGSCAPPGRGCGAGKR